MMRASGAHPGVRLLLANGDRLSGALASVTSREWLVRSCGQTVVVDNKTGAGGTIAMEMLRQHQGPLDAVFVAIGGGGLISGVANYIKAVRPEIKVIGVQMNDSDAMIQSVQARKRVTLADVGLFSDGNVHSHIDHLKALIQRAKQEGVKNVRIHILLDGRDVGEISALDYVLPFEKFLSEIRSSDFDAKIASGGGRMNITMDRYEADWSMVERGWKIHVHGEGRQFASAEQAVTTYRSEQPVIDQNLPGFVIAENGKPVGAIQDGDSVVFFNFRGDRAIEISRAFEEADLKAFDRGRCPKVCYAGMLEYDGDLHIPPRYLVPPPEIKNTMGEFLTASGISQLAISETQKYGHVTYFWNGNRSGKFSDSLETYLEIPSDRVSFDERPWMKAAEITDALIAELRTGKYRTARVNYANGDMVGHTGNLRAATIAMEALDLCLTRLLPVIDSLGGMAIITADHGNADEMYEIDKKTDQPAKSKDGKIKAKTSHTLNPVPCIFYDNQHKDAYQLADLPERGLANLASTTVNLLGFEAPGIWHPSLIRFR